MAVAVGDFNGDGIPRPGHGRTPAGVSVLLGNGDGTFAPSHSPSPATAPGWRWADFNGDGKLDLRRLVDDNGHADRERAAGQRRRQLSPADRTTPRVRRGSVGSSSSATSTATAGPTWRRRGRRSNTVSVLLNDGAWPDAARPPSSIGIGDVTVTEGNTGTRQRHLHRDPVRRLHQPVTVAYATGNGTATAGSDYQAASGAR